MKVLHIGKFYYPYRGGIEKVNKDCVDYLNKAGVKTEVLCFNHSDEIMNEINGVHRSRLSFILAATPFSVQFISTYIKIKNNYDIIHLHLPNPFAAFIVALLGYSGKLVVHWHSDILSQKKLYYFYSIIDKLIKHKAAVILVTSENYMNNSVQLSKFLKKCTVVPIGIEPFVKKSGSINSEEWTKKRKRVLAVGRLVPYKGFEYLILAAKMFGEQVELLIGGTGPMHSKLQFMIDEQKLSHRVKLIGYTTDTEIAELFKSADLFCLPSVEKTEAFGVVLLEAMSVGCPIVACNIIGSGVPWVNKHGVSGLNVIPKDPMDLANAINRILSDYDFWKELTQCGEERFRKLFTINAMGEKLHQIYLGLNVVEKQEKV